MKKLLWAIAAIVVVAAGYFVFVGRDGDDMTDETAATTEAPAATEEAAPAATEEAAPAATEEAAPAATEEAAPAATEEAAPATAQEAVVAMIGGMSVDEVKAMLTAETFDAAKLAAVVDASDLDALNKATLKAAIEAAGQNATLVPAAIAAFIAAFAL